MKAHAQATLEQSGQEARALEMAPSVAAGDRGMLVGDSFAKPKSRIFACPRLVTKMFAGLMSRWTIPF